MTETIPQPRVAEEAALADDDGYNRLAYLCYRIGNRLSGSGSLDKAIFWAKAEMTRDGLVNVSSGLAVKETADRVAAFVVSNGLTLFARIDPAETLRLD